MKPEFMGMYNLTLPKIGTFLPTNEDLTNIW